MIGDPRRGLLTNPPRGRTGFRVDQSLGPLQRVNLGGPTTRMTPH